MVFYVFLGTELGGSTLKDHQVAAIWTDLRRSAQKAPVAEDIPVTHGGLVESWGYPSSWMVILENPEQKWII